MLLIKGMVEKKNWKNGFRISYEEEIIKNVGYSLYNEVKDWLKMVKRVKTSRIKLV